VDLRWLDAPAEDVRRELPTVPEHVPPPWVPTRRRLLVRVNAVALVWTLFFRVFGTGLQVDVTQDGVLTAEDVHSLVVTLVIAVVWVAASIALWVWSRRPSAPVRLRRARRALTARANGYRAAPSWRDTFRAIVTGHSAGVREYPRFVDQDGRVEFGTVRIRMPRTRPRSYVSVTLASPLPHLVLDSVANDGVRSGLPENLAERQRISLEGDFDRVFRAYAPRGYGRDALYVLTPDVMAALADHARDYDVEIIDDRVVFFRADRRRWDDPALWREVEAILAHVVPRVRQRSLRYMDERVDGQAAVDIARNAVRERSRSMAWRPATLVIGPDGRRLLFLTQRNGSWANVRVIATFMMSTAVYGFPVFIGAVALLGIFDGR